MTDLFQLLVSGVINGSVYGVIAVAVSLVFRVSGVVNLAIGQLVVIGSIGAVFLSERFGWPRSVAIAVALGTVMTIAYAADRSVIELALKRGSTLVHSMFVMLGLALALEGGALLVLGRDPYTAPAFLSEATWSTSGVVIQSQGVLVIGFAAVIALGGAWYFHKSLQGKAMTACLDNPRGCRLVGIPVAKLRRIAFVGGAGVAAIGGTLILPLTPMAYSSGFALTLKGTIAAAVVGLGAPLPALLAGVALGLAEALVTVYLSGPFQEVIIFGALGCVLLARPGLVSAREFH